jgi:CheY-like chemotaxis protein
MEGSMLNKVLIIDDDNIFHLIIEDAFREAGYDCELVFKHLATEAMAYLERPTGDFPDAIFLDVNMPIMDGFEFLTEYQQRWYHKHPDTNLVLVTSSVFSSDYEKSQSYDMPVNFIIKPITMEKISAVLQNSSQEIRAD